MPVSIVKRWRVFVYRSSSTSGWNVPIFAWSTSVQRHLTTSTTALWCRRDITERQKSCSVRLFALFAHQLVGLSSLAVAIVADSLLQLSSRTSWILMLLLSINSLMGTGNYSATSNYMKLVHWPLMVWWVSSYIRYNDEGTRQGRRPPRPLLAVPNVTAHPSTASVPITVLHCCIMVRCSAV